VKEALFRRSSAAAVRPPRAARAKVGTGFCGEGKRHKECECISWMVVLRNRLRLQCLRAARGAEFWSAGGERAGRGFVKVTLGCWGVVENLGSGLGHFLDWWAVESCNSVG